MGERQTHSHPATRRIDANELSHKLPLACVSLSALLGRPPARCQELKRASFSASLSLPLPLSGPPRATRMDGRAWSWPGRATMMIVADDVEGGEHWLDSRRVAVVVVVVISLTRKAVHGTEQQQVVDPSPPVRLSPCLSPARPSHGRELAPDAWPRLLCALALPSSRVQLQALTQLAQ